MTESRAAGATAAALLAGITFTRVSAVSLHSENIAPAILAVLFGVGAAGAWRGRRRARQLVPFAITAFAYLVVVSLTYLWATDQSAAGAAASELLLIIVLCIGFISCVRSAHALHAVTTAIIVGGVALSLVSLHQILTGAYTNTYGGYAVSAIENIVGVKNANRIGGPLADPNYFGQLLLIPIAFALQRTSGERMLRARVFAFAAVVICSLTLFLTYSRGALVAWIAVVVAWVWSTFSRTTRNRVLIGAAIAAVFALSIAPATYRARVTQVRDVIPGLAPRAGVADPALEGRSSAFAVGWDMFRDHPLAGVGADNFVVHYGDYLTDTGLLQAPAQLQPHNLYFQIASETGVLGLATFGAVVIGAFVAVNRARAFAVRNALIGYLVASFFLHAAFPQMLWLLLALAWAAPQCEPTLSTLNIRRAASQPQPTEALPAGS